MIIDEVRTKARDDFYTQLAETLKGERRMKLATEIKALKGQVCLGEIQRLQMLATQVPKGGLVVEIGSYCGQSSAAIASGLDPSVKFVCIDPWMKQGGFTYPDGRDYGYETKETLLQFRTATDDWKAQITQIIGWPLDVAAWWGAPIDMINIDCVKEYDALAPIWNAWLPRVKQGGIVCSHDYEPDTSKDWHFPGVVRVIEEIVKPALITETHHHIDFTFSGIKA
jgi:predicted O-methyltransferase YrrM